MPRASAHSEARTVQGEVVELQIQHDLGPRAGARHARARTQVRARAILGYMSSGRARCPERGEEWLSPDG